MATDFLPRREADLITWSANFSTKITATPTAYGLTAPQATAYTALNTAFAAAFATANNPSTRTPSSIVAKDAALDALKANARLLAGIVQAYPGTTDTMRSDLGITVPDADPSPINPPDFAPGMDIISAVVRTLRLRIHDSENPTRRGKPAGVSGASVFSYVGTTPPADISGWKFEGNTTRTIFDVQFDSDVASGATVWVCAFWYNPRAQNGPPCPPVSTNLPGGAVMAA